MAWQWQRPSIARTLAWCAAALLMGNVPVAPPAHADIYRWTDAKGVVHLDDDLARVPAPQRESMRTFQAKAAPAPPETEGATQATFASAISRDLGLRVSALQDPVSVLQVVGIYPANGWNPHAPLSPAVVAQVADATQAAARARRLSQSPAAAEASILRIAGGLGVVGPPPSAPPDPPRAPDPPPVVIAPNIVIEQPPPAQVVVIERPPPPVLSAYPTFFYGVPSAPLLAPRTFGPIPERITPLSNPAGHLHGPLVSPLRSSPFTRPLDF
jgi:hypothetical protein